MFCFGSETVPDPNAVVSQSHVAKLPVNQIWPCDESKGGKNQSCQESSLQLN